VVFLSKVKWNIDWLLGLFQLVGSTIVMNYEVRTYSTDASIIQIFGYAKYLKFMIRYEQDMLIKKL